MHCRGSGNEGTYFASEKITMAAITRTTMNSTVRHHMPAMADAKKAKVADVHTCMLVAPASTTHVMRKATPPTAKSTLVSDRFAGGRCGVTREVRLRG